MAIAVAFVSFLSTLGGGLFALRRNDRLHLVLGFAAGVMLGVVAFDLLPEIANGDGGPAFSTVMIMLVLGFLVLHVVEKSALLHPAHEEEYGGHHHPRVGLVSALALCAHSFLDGVGIGLAFKAGSGVGIAVAVAVIAHDFADGLNTVTLMKLNRNSDFRSRVLLGLDAVAPVLGAASTLLFSVPATALHLYLGFFAGFLLYLATADILPEAHARHPSQLTLLTTFGGVGVMYAVTSVL
ncbi:MAG: ZIP family metal transporter [Actinomycetota bacterium]|nr:ZIP family metal transporter [Actinomycetota bacterium]